MKRQIAFLLLTVALAVPSPSVAQISNGDVLQVAYKGTSGYYDSTYLPFYHFDITGMPGTPYWDFLCVDNLNYISAGAIYNAKFTAVETDDLSDLAYTREGSDQLRLAPNPTSLGIALTNYRIAAYLYLQAVGQDLGTNTGKQALADLQRAAWYATNPSYVDGLNTYYTTAQAAVANGWKANDFFVVTAVDDKVGDYIRATGGKQEYLVYSSSAVPEPGTVVLLATGLLGVAFVGRRRRKLTELDVEA